MIMNTGGMMGSNASPPMKLATAGLGGMHPGGAGGAGGQRYYGQSMGTALGLQINIPNSGGGGDTSTNNGTTTMTMTSPPNMKGKYPGNNMTTATMTTIGGANSVTGGAGGGNGFGPGGGGPSGPGGTVGYSSRAMSASIPGSGNPTGRNGNRIAKPPTPSGGPHQFEVKETKDVKRNKAQLPSQIKHAKPTRGDWLKKRYIVNNYILLDTLGTGSYGEVGCDDMSHVVLCKMMNVYVHELLCVIISEPPIK
jgi:hypothetical protein